MNNLIFQQNSPLKNMRSVSPKKLKRNSKLRDRFLKIVNQVKLQNLSKKQKNKTNFSFLEILQRDQKLKEQKEKFKAQLIQKHQNKSLENNKKDLFQTGLASLLKQRKNKIHPTLQFTFHKGVSQNRSQTQLKEKAKELNQCIEKLDYDQRLLKGARHFFDALNAQDIRNDVEFMNWLELFVYKWQSHYMWQNWLLFLSWCLIIITYVEQNQFEEAKIVSGLIWKGLEAFIFLNMMVDNSLEWYHWRIIKNKQKQNYNLIARICLLLLLLIDLAISFRSSQSKIRFSKPLRAIMLLFYNREIKDNVIIIFKLAKSILTVFILFVSIIIIFGLIACNHHYHIISLVQLIGDITLNTDQYVNSFQSLLKSVTILFSLMNFDLYPESIIPAVYTSKFYFIFFIFFLMMFDFFFLPIPTASLYSQFKEERKNMIIKERILQRSQLFISFLTTDIDKKGYMNYDEFMQLMKTVYGMNFNQLRMEQLFQKVDDNNNKQLVSIFLFSIIYLSPQKNSLPQLISLRKILICLLILSLAIMDGKSQVNILIQHSIQVSKMDESKTEG